LMYFDDIVFNMTTTVLLHCCRHRSGTICVPSTVNSSV
jgi:hypothetical protein